MKLTEFSIIFFLGLIPCIAGGLVVGGIEQVPVDDPEIVRLSQVALTSMNAGKEASGSANLVEIVSASRQVVSGVLTRLTLKVTREGKEELCTLKIWEQLWLNKTEVTLDGCEESGASDSKSGITEKDVSNDKNDINLELFNAFVKTHDKVYADDKEYKKRFRVFRANLNKIKLLRKSEQGTAQYGITKFSDLSAKEFKSYLGLNKPKSEDDLPPADIPDIELPNHFDWRHYNAVTPVKDQKSCGSCWAFSVTGNIEGQWAIKKGKLISLSEQELVDCDSSDNGCEGGYMTTAYKAIINLGGLETESDYPYEAQNDACHFNKSKAKVKISGGVNITSDEIKMAKWLAKNGPMSVALNANAMQFYSGGVSHPLKFLCDPSNLNHGVLIVGFGVHHSSILNKTLPYWIIKNSWGTRWGEKGYYRLYRGNGSCGVDQMVSSAVVN